MFNLSQITEKLFLKFWLQFINPEAVYFKYPQGNSRFILTYIERINNEREVYLGLHFYIPDHMNC